MGASSFMGLGCPRSKELSGSWQLFLFMAGEDIFWVPSTCHSHWRCSAPVHRKRDLRLADLAHGGSTDRLSSRLSASRQCLRFSIWSQGISFGSSFALTSPNMCPSPPFLLFKLTNAARAPPAMQPQRLRRQRNLNYIYESTPIYFFCRNCCHSATNARKPLCTKEFQGGGSKVGGGSKELAAEIRVQSGKQRFQA